MNDFVTAMNRDELAVMDCALQEFVQNSDVTYDMRRVTCSSVNPYDLLMTMSKKIHKTFLNVEQEAKRAAFMAVPDLVVEGNEIADEDSDEIWENDQIFQL